MGWVGVIKQSVEWPRCPSLPAAAPLEGVNPATALSFAVGLLSFFLFLFLVFLPSVDFHLAALICLSCTFPPLHSTPLLSSPLFSSEESQLWWWRFSISEWILGGPCLFIYLFVRSFICLFVDLFIYVFNCCFSWKRLKLSESNVPSGRSCRVWRHGDTWAERVLSVGCSDSSGWERHFNITPKEMLIQMHQDVVTVLP